MSDRFIRLSKSCITVSEKKAVMEVLDAGYLGMGSNVCAFENELANFFGRPVVCVVNGTAALHLAISAAGIGHGDEVLVQSLTYVASFQAISAVGAKPVACEIHPKTLTINLDDAERKITAKTKAIMPVHYAGGVGDLEAVYALAKKYQLRVIEDAAHAFGSIYQSIRVGGFGDIACFSFDGIKNITSGEGGCIVTDDKLVLERLRDARLLGVKNDSNARYQGGRSWSFDVDTQGWRYHMSNIMAAIGLVQLGRFPLLSQKRQSLASRYDQLLSKGSHIELIDQNYNLIVPHIYPILLPNMVSRALLREKLLSHGVETGVHYQPNHQLTFYSQCVNGALPITENIFNKLLTLPLHPDLSLNDIDYVVDKLDLSLKELGYV